MKIRSTIPQFLFALGLAASGAGLWGAFLPGSQSLELAPLVSVAQASDSVDIPMLTSPVMDEAGYLSDSSRSQLQSLILGLNQDLQIQLAIYIPKSLQGLDIESFSIQVVDRWKLGQAETDRGLLLILAPNERKMRIEVGYGLEGVLTDLWSKRSLDDLLRPALKAGEPAAGLADWVAEVRRKLGQSAELSAQEEQALSKKAKKASRSLDLNENFWSLLIFLVFFILVPRLGGVGARARSGRHSYGWGGMSGGGFGQPGGGGGFSGGGGGFGGGGASSDW